MCTLDRSSATSEKRTCLLSKVFFWLDFILSSSEKQSCIHFYLTTQFVCCSATQTHTFDLVAVIHLNAGWRAAEEDIIQCPIILLGHGRLVFVGCWRWGGWRLGPNIRCPTQYQWMDNGYPSILHVSLSHGLKPTTMSISKQFDPLSWLIHQPSLIYNLDWASQRKESWIWRSEWVQNIEFRGTNEQQFKK